MGKKWKQWPILFSWALKSLWIVTVAMKLKDTCSLVGKLWQTSVQISRSVMSNSLQLHGLQHARLACPSLSPRACSNSCPLSQWCHPTISSSIIPFSSCPQSFPVSGSFPVSWLFPSGGQSIGSFNFSLSPSDEYSGLICFKIDWFDLLAVQGTLKSLL